MTSTNQCSLGSRNSSRVIKPPGGSQDSSFNIFGVPMEDRRPKSQQSVPQANPDAATPPEKQELQETKESETKTEAQNEKMANNEEPTESNVKENDDDKDKEKEEIENQEGSNTNSEISQGTENNEAAISVGSTAGTTETTTTATTTTATTSTTSATGAEPKYRASKVSGFNPITGEPYNKVTDTASAPTTNVRVRQPPGGASSKLW